MNIIVNILFAASRPKKLFTPGPLGVSMTTKEAMLKDVGSRDKEFVRLIQEIRTKLVDLAGMCFLEQTWIDLITHLWSISYVLHNDVN